jgi:putative FmdB family regulatory protein
VPIFEYQCQACKHVVEVLQKNARSQETVCPACGAHDLKKCLSGFAVGQSKASRPAACEACPSTSCPGDMACSGGGCPMG